MELTPPEAQTQEKSSSEAPVQIMEGVSATSSDTTTAEQDNTTTKDIVKSANTPIAVTSVLPGSPQEEAKEKGKSLVTDKEPKNATVENCNMGESDSDIDSDSDIHSYFDSEDEDEFEGLPSMDLNDFEYSAIDDTTELLKQLRGLTVKEMLAKARARVKGWPKQRLQEALVTGRMLLMTKRMDEEDSRIFAINLEACDEELRRLNSLLKGCG
ncbi:hypothetical protein BGZ94_002742 [Podila epigama]|nr:hypothetical protein BGZ94_002742 [Podila epigama]